jgi:hypothetical protein
LTPASRREETMGGPTLPEAPTTMTFWTVFGDIAMA